VVDLIKSLCNKKGITVSALGVELGLGKNSITRWDENKPSVDRVQKVADYFGVSVDYLLSRTDDPHPAISNDDVKNAIDEYVKSKGKQSTVIRYNGKEQTYETLDMTDEEWEIAQATIEALRLKRK
jgi:rep protein